MYSISKRFDFSAAHHLNGLPPEHPCSRIHGHNYSVTLHLKSEILTKEGFVLDYRKLDVFKSWLDENFDHQDLNEKMQGIDPTAENLAKYCYDVWAEDLGLFAVTVKETDKTEARYES